ncbi:MAG: hypothetical protein KC442_02140, partial [Thermomicrobiales bacterium]|nr:hypothetical protein [Thermomicrobiales bacterium]
MLAAGVTAAFRAIATSAVVAFDIGVDERGNFIDLPTGAVNHLIPENYSRMKHGDLDAVSFFAGPLAAKALRAERFTEFLRNAVAHERVVYVTTASVFSVPSASNLLLKTTATHINILLAKMGLAPIVVAEQTRLSDSRLGYISQTVREIRSQSSAGRDVTIVPEHFRNQSVIFLDDLFNSGNTVDRAQRRLRNVSVADTFYLFAVRMDPQVVGASDGGIEDCLNDAYITGSLESMGPMLQRGNFVAVQKLLHVIFDPKHTDQLPGFLQEIPTASIVKLYAAAACDGLRHRRQRLYFPSVLVFETVLQERGALDAEGHLTGAPV